MNRVNVKYIEYVLLLVTFCVLSFSLYSQYVLGLQPCPLCLMQRLCVSLLLILMGLEFWVHNSLKLKVSQFFIASAGLFFALRQLWLQSLPSGSAPACMPGLDILIHYFPWQDIVHALLWGSGDCAEAAWRFLGISLAGWSALYFLFIDLVLLFLYGRKRTLLPH